MNEQWEVCKKKVADLPARYEEIIKAMSKNPIAPIFRQRKNKGTVIRAEMSKIDGFEVTLLVKYHDEKGVVEAKYYAWNGPDSLCYVRDLLNLDDGLVGEGVMI